MIHFMQQYLTGSTEFYHSTYQVMMSGEHHRQDPRELEADAARYNDQARRADELGVDTMRDICLALRDFSLSVALRLTAQGTSAARTTRAACAAIPGTDKDTAASSA